MSDFPVYITFCVLNLKLKWKFFDTQWRDEYDWVLQGQKTLQDFWTLIYKNCSIPGDLSSL